MELNLLFEILKCALSSKSYSGTLTVNQFETVLRQAEEQAIFGLIFNAIHNAEIIAKEGLAEGEVGKSQMAIFEAVGLQEQIKQQNEIVNERAEMLTRIFASWGYKSCILKGQGVAQLYPNSLLRQSGDIEILVDGKQDDIVTTIRNNFVGIRNIDYVQSNAAFFTDVGVKVYFRPSWMYNPLNNRKLQKYFSEHKKEQFENKDKTKGGAYPTIEFNLVCSLVQINRYILEEGIGLRLLVDYFYILKHSKLEERDKAYMILCNLSLKKFTAAMMYVEKNVLGIEDDFLLCIPNQKEGEFLIDELISEEKFESYDSRRKYCDVESRIKRGLIQLKRDWRYMKHYPGEMLWKPIWKVCHWCWRKRNGYL